MAVSSSACSTVSGESGLDASVEVVFDVGDTVYDSPLPLGLAGGSRSSA